eukprot:maker-scaffold160_size295910-snap-gene-0.6 protein:Tk01224 transcript:maker-scaffold160_size295910-snap-gene-0.6-mRNA-1 annotation:"g2 mitotic-specific cyclin-a"
MADRSSAPRPASWFPDPPTHVPLKPLVPSRPSGRAPLASIQPNGPGRGQPIQMKKPHQTFSIFEDVPRDGFSTIGPSGQPNTIHSPEGHFSHRIPMPTMSRANSMPFPIHMDTVAAHETENKENIASASSSRVDSSSDPFWNDKLATLPRIPSVETSQRLFFEAQASRQPLQPIQVTNPSFASARCRFTLEDETNTNAIDMDSSMGMDISVRSIDEPEETDSEGESENESHLEPEYLEDDRAAASDELLMAVFDSEEYLDDIYTHLRSIETKHVAKSNYMIKQPDITFSMRGILIDWLIEVGEEYKLHQETLYLAVNYIDRFLSFMSVQRPKLQLVGTACMFIAAKYEEIYPPDVGEFVYITDDTYSKKQVLRMEHLVLKVLGFDLAVPTPLVFVNLFARQTDCDDETLCLAQYLSELTLMDAKVYLGYRPSIIGAASVALARHTLGLAAWPQNVVEMSSLNVEDFKDCLVNLHATFTEAPALAQQAIRDKYKHARFHGVSNLEPTAIF